MTSNGRKTAIRLGGLRRLLIDGDPRSSFIVVSLVATNVAKFPTLLECNKWSIAWSNLESQWSKINFKGYENIIQTQKLSKNGQKIVQKKSKKIVQKIVLKIAGKVEIKKPILNITPNRE